MALTAHDLDSLSLEFSPKTPDFSAWDLLEADGALSARDRMLLAQEKSGYEPPDVPDPPEPGDVEWADYMKNIMAGGGGIVEGVGWLSKQVGFDKIGDTIENLGSRAVDYWNNSMSDAAKAELSKEFVVKDPDSPFGYSWGDASLSTVGLMGAQSLLGTAAGIGAGAGLTKVLQIFANPYGRKALVTAARLGGPKSAAADKLKLVNDMLRKGKGGHAPYLGKLGTTVTGAIGFGLGEGAVSGITAGASVENLILDLSHEDLMAGEASQRYSEVYNSAIQTGVEESAAQEYAKRTIAGEASSIAGLKAGLSVALMGAPAGAFFGGLMNPVAVRMAARGRTVQALTGVGAEATQEFFQSGTEQYISNVETAKAGADVTPFEGVLNAAVGGAAAGGVVGGAFGLATSESKRAAQLRQDLETTDEREILRTITKKALDAGVGQEAISTVLEEEDLSLIQVIKKIEALVPHGTSEGGPPKPPPAGPAPPKAKKAKVPKKPVSPVSVLGEEGTFEPLIKELEESDAKLKETFDQPNPEAVLEVLAKEVPADTYEQVLSIVRQDANLHQTNEGRKKVLDEVRDVLSAAGLNTETVVRLTQQPEGVPKALPAAVAPELMPSREVGPEKPISRESVLAQQIKPTGGESRVVTGAGTEIDTRYEVVDVADLTVSHDEAGGVNPQYPSEMQPRDRSRKASQAQINKIARKLNPELLGENPQAAHGAPIVGADSVVESGNGRVAAVRLAYQSVPEKAKEYRAWLKENAAKFGIDPESIPDEGMPMLVRVRETATDRAEFARQSNQEAISRMSPGEQARADSARLQDADMELFNPDESGNLLSASNEKFLRAFAQRLGQDELSGMVTKDGRYTKQMADRIQSAIFWKAYQDENLLTLQAEEADPDVKGVVNALSQAAGTFARVRTVHGDLGELDVAPAIVEGATILREARSRGISLEQFLDQGGLFGEAYSPEGQAFARFMEANKRSTKRMAAGLKALAEFTDNEMKRRQTKDMLGGEDQGIEAAVGHMNTFLEERYGQKATIEADLFGAPGVREGGAPGRGEGGEQAGEPGAEADTTEAPESVKPWYEQHGEEIKEAIFAEMRSIREKADAASQRERELQPPPGSIPVGAGQFDEFIRAFGLNEFLAFIGEGATPSEAAAKAKESVGEAVQSHNSRRQDYTWQRSEGTESTTIDDAMRQLTTAAKAQKPKEPEPTPEPAAKTQWAAEYKSPRVDKLSKADEAVRETAIALAQSDGAAIKTAATQMAKLVGPGDVLVPIPDHTGSTDANRKLAQAIANQKPGTKVADILTREPGDSQRERRRSGKKGLSAEEIKTTIKDGAAAPKEGNVVFIDNVETTGATIASARKAVGSGRGVVYAKAPEVTDIAAEPAQAAFEKGARVQMQPTWRKKPFVGTVVGPAKDGKVRVKWDKDTLPDFYGSGLVDHDPADLDLIEQDKAEAPAGGLRFSVKQPSQLDMLIDAMDFITDLKGSRNPAKNAEEAWQRYLGNTAVQRSGGENIIGKDAFVETWEQLEETKAEPETSKLRFSLGGPSLAGVQVYRGGKDGVWFTDNPSIASRYASYSDEETPASARLVGADLVLENPYEVDMQGADVSTQREAAIKKAKAGGHDGVIFRDAGDPGPSDVYGTSTDVGDIFLVFDREAAVKRQKETRYNVNTMGAAKKAASKLRFSLASPVDLTWSEGPPGWQGSHQAFFEVDGVEFSVDFEKSYGRSFHVTFGPAEEVRGRKGVKRADFTHKTAAGAFKVMNGVYKSLTDFLARSDPGTEIHFSAEADSKIKLYDRITERLAKSGYLIEAPHIAAKAALKKMGKISRARRKMLEALGGDKIMGAWMVTVPQAMSPSTKIVPEGQTYTVPRRTWGWDLDAAEAASKRYGEEFRERMAEEQQAERPRKPKMDLDAAEAAAEQYAVEFRERMEREQPPERPRSEWGWDLDAAEQAGREYGERFREEHGESNLRFSLAPPAESAAFDEWFGDSVVVDDEGEPLVVYHGTDAEIVGGVFDLESTRNQDVDTGLGTFFASRASEAQWFAQEETDLLGSRSDKFVIGGNLVPVYLAINRPMVYETQSAMREALNDTSYNREGPGHALRLQLESQGYDGVIVRDSEFEPDGTSGQWIVAFRPEQIKSAVGNVGTYSGSDIRFSLAAPADSPAFNQWFRDSVVVDDEGEPLVVYHGTRGEFEGPFRTREMNAHFAVRHQGAEGRFKGTSKEARKRVAIRTQENLKKLSFEQLEAKWAEVMGPGKGVPVNPRVATLESQQDYMIRELADFLSRDADGPAVMPVYISAKKLFRISDWGFRGTPLIHNLLAAAEILGPTIPEAQESGVSLLQARWSGDTTGLQANVPKALIRRLEKLEVDLGSTAAVKALLEEYGYDGLVYTNAMEDAGYDSIIPFRPEQIKSAVGNVGTYSQDDPSILNSLAPGDVSAGMDAEGLTKLYGKIAKTWKTAPRFEVVQDWQDLPPKHQAELKSLGFEYLAEAFYDPGDGTGKDDKIWVIASNVANEDRAIRAFLEESLGHRGLARTFGKDLTPFLERVYKALGRQYFKGIAGQYRLDLSTAIGRQRAAEETLAKIGADPELRSRNKTLRDLWDEFVTYVKQWLEKRGIALKLTERDLTVIMRRVTAAADLGLRAVDPGRAGSLAPVYSLSPVNRIDDPHLYFSYGDNDDLVDVGNLVLTKLPEENFSIGRWRLSYDQAIEFMVQNAAGERPKRGPITVMPLGNGTYAAIDGNANVAAAPIMGISRIPVQYTDYAEELVGLELDNGDVMLHPTTDLTRLIEMAHTEKEELDAAMEGYGVEHRSRVKVTTLEGGEKNTTVREKLNSSKLGRKMLGEALVGGVLTERQADAEIVTKTGYPRAVQKTLDAGKSPAWLSDFVGTQIKVDSVDEARRLAKRIMKDHRVLMVDDFLDGGRPDGYRGLHLQVQFNGHGMSAEVQIHVPEMMDILDEAHVLYDVARVPGLHKRIVAGLTQASQAMYGEAWKAYEERAGSATEAPLSSISGVAAEEDTQILRFGSQTSTTPSGELVETKRAIRPPSMREGPMITSPGDTSGRNLPIAASLSPNESALRFSIAGTMEEEGSAEEETARARTIESSEADLGLQDRVDKKLKGLKGWWASRDLVQGMVDFADSVKQMELTFVESLTGVAKLLDAKVSAYKMVHLVRELPSVMAAVFKRGVPVYKDGGFVMVEGRKGFMEIFAPLWQTGKSKLHLWEFYAATRRAERLLAEGREHNFTEDDIEIGRRLGDKHPEFEQVWNDYQEFNENLLDLAVERGAMTQEMAEAWKTKDYIPFYRVMEELELGPGGTRLSGQRVTSKYLKGGEGKIAPPFESMIMNTAYIIDKVYRNEAMRRIVELGTGTTSPTGHLFLEPLPNRPDAVKITREQMIRALLDADIITDSDDIAEADLKEMETLFQMVAPTGKDVVSVMIKGKAKFYRVNDPMLLRTINAMGVQNFGLLMGAMRGSKKLLTTWVTADPAFMLRNFIRDTLSAWVISDTKLIPLVSAFRGARKAFMQDDIALSLWMAGSGGGGWYDPNPKDMRKLATQHMPAAEVSPFLATIVSPKRLWQVWQRLGNASEMANRIAIAEQVLANGGSMAEAAYQAKNLLNFTKSGDMATVQMLIQTVPFLNARIQGIARLVEGARENPVGFAMKGMTLAALSLALLAHNRKREEYEGLEDWDKDIYWHFWIEDEHFRLPKPFEVGAIFATVAERVARAMAGDDDWGDFADRMGFMFGETFAFNPMPQLGKPLWELYANKSFFTGTPIVGQAHQGVLPEAQYQPWTSESLKAMAEAMPDFAPEWMRSPLRLEAAARGYLGSMSLSILGIADMGARSIGGEVVRPEMEARDWPLIGNLIKSFKPGDPRSSKYLDELYEATEEAGKLFSTINRLKQSRPEFAAQLREENQNKLSRRKHLNKIVGAIRKLNAKSRRVWADRNLSAEEKRAQIDAITSRKLELARDANDYIGDW